MTGILALTSAFWLGILTAISPCPLATNIAAVSFISRATGTPRKVLLSGFAYAAGRVAAYVLLAALLLSGLLASGTVARALQRYLSVALGPLLILIGMALLGMIGTGISVSLAGRAVQDRAATGGVWWSGVMGFLFALSFCPGSAVLYFGALIPLAAANESRLALPAAFGLGTALPVIVFSFLIVFAAHQVGRAFERLSQIERWVRFATGGILIVAGIYLTLTHVYGLSLTL